MAGFILKINTIESNGFGIEHEVTSRRNANLAIKLYKAKGQEIEYAALYKKGQSCAGQEIKIW